MNTRTIEVENVKGKIHLEFGKIDNDSVTIKGDIKDSTGRILMIIDERTMKEDDELTINAEIAMKITHSVPVI